MRRRVALGLTLALGGGVMLTLALLRMTSPAAASTPPSSIAAGASFTCAATFDTTVRCWGYNSSGQLGNGTTTDSAVPVDVCEPGTVLLGAGGPPPSSCCPIVFGVSAVGALPSCELGGISQVTAGYAHACGLTTAASVMCWGDNSIGQLGDGTTTNRTRPVDVCDPGIIVFGVGGGGPPSCCPILLGTSFAVAPQAPLPACGTLDGITQVAAGAGHTCALEDTGAVWCWGNNANGQLGNGTSADSSEPVEVCGGTPILLGEGPAGFLCSPLTGVVSIDAGHTHTCAAMNDGGVQCWGANDYGQLGNASTTDSAYPVDVCARGILAGAEGAGSACCPFVLGGPLSGLIQAPLPGCYLSDVASVSAGGDHTCAVLVDTSAVCWGYNQHGELGSGMNSDSTRPVDVCEPLSSASAGIASCCPISLTGGIGPSCTPLSGIDTIDAGYRHSCAVMTGRSLLCWGVGFSGQLGTGGSFDTSVPIAVCDTALPLAGVLPICSPLSGTAAARTGYSHTCALMDDKRALCWGPNIYGELGNAAMIASFVPSEVVGFGTKVTPTPTATIAPVETSLPTPVEPTNTSTPGAGATSTPTRTPTPALVVTSTPTPSGGLLGDANCDGAVNAIDAAFILQLVAGLIGSLPCPQNADVNSDGDIDPIDSALILQYTAGLIPGL